MKRLSQNPKLTVDILFLITSLSRIQSKTPFFRVINGKDPRIGTIFGPGGFLYFLLVHIDIMIMESKTKTKAVLIISDI